MLCSSKHAQPTGIQPYWLTIVILCITILSPSFVGAQSGPRPNVDCEALIRDTEKKREKLTQYIEALKHSHRDGDLALAAIFNHEIGRVIEQIQALEAKFDCVKNRKVRNHEGLSPTKSDDGIFQNKTCGELRRMQVKLAIEINSLKRRQHSTFSRLTDSELTNLETPLENLVKFAGILRTRCVRDRRSGRGYRRR